jgi:branched-chain amino acid transport system ATP-binding protein
MPATASVSGAARRDPQLREPARAALHEVGSASASDVPRALSHGERRVLELAMVLATRPRLLLLDEPMAVMGPANGGHGAPAGAMKGRLAIVLVEHDMDAVFALADRISVMVYGQHRQRRAGGDPRLMRRGAPDNEAILP